MEVVGFRLKVLGCGLKVKALKGRYIQAQGKTLGSDGMPQKVSETPKPAGEEAVRLTRGDIKPQKIIIKTMFRGVW